MLGGTVLSSGSQASKCITRWSMSPPCLRGQVLLCVGDVAGLLGPSCQLLVYNQR